MDDGELCAMMAGTQRTLTLPVVSLDMLVLPVQPATAQALVQGEYLLLHAACANINIHVTLKSKHHITQCFI